MPQTVTTDPQDDQLDELDAFVLNEQQKKAQAPPDDDVTPWLMNRRARKAQKAPSPPAAADDDSGLDDFVKTYPRQPAVEPQSTISIVPFGPPVASESLSDRAAKLGQPMIPMTPPLGDSPQVPLNVFSGDAQRPPDQQSPVPTTPPGVDNDPAEWVQRMDARADTGKEQLLNKLSTGSKGLPLPYIAPDGTPRTMKLGDFQKLAADYLDDPSIPKSRGAAFAAGAAADAVSTLNDVFFSPIGMASAVTGLAAARALQTAGKQGAVAIKLGQEYQEMQRAGASADELAEHAEQFRQAVAATKQTQNIVTGARTAQRAAGIGFGTQGASQVITGIQRKDLPTILAGLGGMALGGSELLTGATGDISEGVKADTARMAVDNVNDEAEAGPVPNTPPGEKNVTAQGSHEIVPEAEQAAPAGTPQLPAPKSVGAGEELTPEKPETIQAQVDALAKGTNPVVYIPKGQENAPEPPSGASVTTVGGDKPGAGTYYHDDSVTPAEIKAAVKDGTYGELLGNTQTKQEATASGQPVAVVARTPSGDEAKSSVVAGGPEGTEAVGRQATELSKQFPDANISVETPEQVVAGRQSSAAPNASQTAASPETPQAQSVTTKWFTAPGEDDIDGFVQAHREASAVTRPQSPELRTLAGKIQDIEPHVADALNGLADGRYFSREDLLKIAGGIRNAKTSNDLKAIVNEFGADRQSVPAAETTATTGNAEASQATQASSASAQSVPEHVEQVRNGPEGVRAGENQNGNQLRPQAAPARIGDRVAAKSGPLKGKPLNVTKVGATGIYGEADDGGPIKFLKTGDFGPLLDDEGKPITTGQGTPLRDAFDTTGTRIQQLAQTIRENIGGSKPISDRVDYATKMAERHAKGKDQLDRSLDPAKALMGALWDAYTAPPKWTDYEEALGKYQGAIQKSAFGLRDFAREIKKAVPDPIRREAITNFIEAAGDRETLQRWAEQSKPKFKAGYKAALTLTDVEKTIARNVIATQDERFQLDKAAGLLEHEVDNYVMHAWRRENPYTKKLVSNVRAQMLQTKPSFTKQRVFGTFFDGEKAGYAPVNKDIGFLFAAREHAADQAIAARAFIKSMLEGKAADGRPLAAVSGSGHPVEKEDAKKAHFIDPKTKTEDTGDYRTIDHPALRKWTWASNDSKGDPIFVKGDLVVHPEAYSHLKNVLGKSALRNIALVQVAQKVNAAIKSAELSFSAFHQTQESLHAIFHRVNPTWTNPIDFSNPKHARLIDHGLQVASFNSQEQFSEGLSSGLVERIPLVGKHFGRYNDYLFSDLIPRLKMAMATDALERNLKRYNGKISEDQIYALTANEANAAFGELNYTMLGRNKTMQDVLRMALLAPDFLEARGRFVGQALRPYGREQALALITGALGLYVAARILNALLTGNPRWEAQNAFDLVYKGRSYTLRSVPADIIHLFTDPRGFIYNRLSPVGRAAIEGITGRDRYGRKQSAIQQAKDFVGGAMPIPAQGYLKNSENGPLDTVLTSAGITTRPYLSPAARMARGFALDSMPLGEGSENRKDANQLARQLEDRLRKKQITTHDVTRLRQQGKITVADQTRILARAARTPLQNSFRSLTAPQAIQVWDKADAGERKQIRPLLANKLSRLDSAPQDQRVRLKARILAALHGTRPASTSAVPMHAPGSR